MRKGNVTILASIFTMLLVAMGVGAGTMAYFYDIEQANENEFTIGTLDMKIKKAGGDWKDDESASVVTGTWAVTDWAPGEEITGTLVFSNIGTIGIKYLYIDFCNYQEGSGAPWLYDAILVTGLQEYIDGQWYDNTAMLVDKWDPLHNNDGKCQLYELLVGVPGSSGDPWDMVLYEDWDGDGEPEEIVDDGEVILLEVGGEVYKLEITLKLPRDISNDYQGDGCSFDMRLLATNVGPTEGVVGPTFP